MKFDYIVTDWSKEHSLIGVTLTPIEEFEELGPSPPIFSLSPEVSISFDTRNKQFKGMLKKLVDGEEIKIIVDFSAVPTFDY